VAKLPLSNATAKIQSSGIHLHALLAVVDNTTVHNHAYYCHQHYTTPHIPTTPKTMPKLKHTVRPLQCPNISIAQVDHSSCLRTNIYKHISQIPVCIDKYIQALCQTMLHKLMLLTSSMQFHLPQSCCL
jgi:hypothetical protein